MDKKILCGVVLSLFVAFLLTRKDKIIYLYESEEDYL